MKKWEVFSLRTVRKKLLMVSKLAGIALDLSLIHISEPTRPY